MKKLFVILIAFSSMIAVEAQKKKKKAESSGLDAALYEGMKWRNIGPTRGGRSVTSTGVVSDPMTYYMGTTGGGIWKTNDAGISWKNISDGQLKTGTVGAIAVSESDPNVIYVGMGEHAVRGVMTSSGDGVYKSTDAGKTWKHLGLEKSMHISDVIIHPKDPDIVFIAVQGALYGSTKERGVYKSIDGGITWRKVLYVAENSGASSLSMDMNNPRILYAAMWQHQRYPWTVSSGGPNSGLYKSVDAGETWEKMEEGLPEEFGKSGISVSRANSNRVFAIVEAEGKKSGLYRSDDAGKKWTQINSDRVLITRSWYYMEVFADPQDENKVYVLNAPAMKSIDGGRSFQNMSTPHGDNHHLWINPTNNKLMINSNDGGGNVSLNGGQSWSTQQNQATAQFYRVITDNQVPYNVYGGQQDNSAIAIASRTNGWGIGWKDWYSVAGCESAYLAFDPENPDVIYGGCYQGIIERWVKESKEGKPIMQYPEERLSGIPKDFRYRFNWNAPIIASPHDPNTIYHAGNVVFKTTDGGQNWETVSPDLTQNDSTRQGPGGRPYTNEAAGGENYNTLMYLVESPHKEGVLWAGSDDGMVHITQNGGDNWTNVTPSGLAEGIVNAIEVSPHDPGTAYLTVMRYKFNDLTPLAYKTSNYGVSWTKITSGLNDPNGFVRVIRADPKVKGLLYAGTEIGLYISDNDGANWSKFQLNLPIVPINDLTIRQNDLVAATAGRSFWILDDLSAIQQTAGKGKITKGLYAKENHYRILGGSAPLEAGKNPPSGVTFDYFLPEELPDSVALHVEILKDDQVIRSYSNQKDEDFKTWQGGPPPAPVLPAKQGVNRFTWDFKRKTLPAVDGVFAFGDYSGSRVGPGKYIIRLMTDKDTLNTAVNILEVPGQEYTASVWNEQQNMLISIEGMIKDMHESVNSMRSAKAQLNDYQKRLKGNEDAKVLLDTAKALVAKIKKWENQLIQPKQKTFQDVINFQNKLNSQLMSLKSFIDVADPRVTSGAKDRFNDLKDEWESYAERRNQLIDVELKAFNDLYKRLDLPAVILED
ncbi:glycosyl hydrolase [Ekhidna sp.]|uniref:WD40/YVTN/BNR-like repeat-containing protein n=1 Tax=Ekhidna sp. TaxID=2608089 RepID=UPI00329977FE